MLSAKTRKALYAVLGVLNLGLLAAAQANAFASAPRVAYGVALASACLATFMREWHAPDAPVLPALEAAGAKVIPLVQPSPDRGSN